jgi:hypothetical protein
MEECFSKLLKDSTLKFEKCVEETSSSCYKLQHWSLRKCAKEVFQVVEIFKFQVCQRKFFVNVTNFKSNSTFVQESFQVFESFL